MWDALTTARGKPGSPLKILLIGTLAPALTGWWHDLIEDGSGGSTFVQALRGNPARWDQWPEIRRCNPLVSAFADSRKVLLEERAQARRDSRLKARFFSYRLNVPTADEATMLLSVDDFNAACQREVPSPCGRPIVGIDLGGGRAWSAAVALWSSGRCEAMAVAPGVPSVEAQEKTRPGATRNLPTANRCRPAARRRGLAGAAGAAATGRGAGRMGCVGTISSVIGSASPSCWTMQGGTQVVPRVTRWSEASEDIRAVRRLFVDGPITPTKASRPLLIASLAVAMVKNDDQGSTRLIKQDPNNNTGRDDVAAALTLAAGSLSRYLAKPRGRGAYVGLIS